MENPSEQETKLLPILICSVEIPNLSFIAIAVVYYVFVFLYSHIKLGTLKQK